MNIYLFDSMRKRAAAAIAVFALSANLSAAQEVVGKWDCGESPNVPPHERTMCTLYDDGKFVISGSGRTQSTGAALWEEHWDDIVSLVIEDGVTGIGQGAPHFYASVTSITSLSLTPPSVWTYFAGVSRTDCIVYVPQEAVKTYREAHFWSDFENIVGIGESDHHASIRQTFAGKQAANGPQVSVRGKALNIKTSPQSSSQLSTQSLQVRMIDMRGKTVLSRSVDGGTAISLAKVPAGRYVVDVKRQGRRVGSSSVVVR